MQRLPWLAWLLTTVATFTAALAEDWPQYRGPRRDDVSTETGLLKQWPAEGPPLLWTYAETGIGYSGPAVVGDRLYTLGGREESEYLIALDLKAIQDGAPAQAWATRVGPLFDWEGNRWSAGPSGTPTVDRDLIFALGGNGDLICVRADDGAEVWRKNLPEEFGAQVNPIGGGPKNLGWGFTWSPLVDGDRLICLPGGPQGTVAALDRRTGDVVWRSSELTQQAAYTSPMPAVVDGVRQFVVLTNQGLFGVAADDGRLLWSAPRRYGTEVVNSPIVHGSLIFTTVGSGQGCDLVRIERNGEGFQATPLYTNNNLTNHHGNVLLWKDHIYGFSQGKGWTCLNLESGEIVWSERRVFRAGAVTCAAGRLYCYSEEDGAAALVEANPEGWKELGRFTIPQQSSLRKPNGKIWTPPVVSGGRLFLRDQELLFCYDVKER
jgi:outer membrane protein assembly factor BamB